MLNRWTFLVVAMLCVHVSVAGNGRRPGQAGHREKEKEPPTYGHYNFQSYQVAPETAYEGYDGTIPDYEDDPRLDQTMCNYTQADMCRQNGFTNLTALSQAGECLAKNHTIGNNKYTHECSLTNSYNRVNYCCCQFFNQAKLANYTLLMCCKRNSGARGVYACNNFWNTVDQINEYGDYDGFNTASSFVVHLMTFAACLLLTTSWSSEHR